MTIEERLRTEMKNDLIELLLKKGYSLDEALDEIEAEYYGMIDYLLNELYHETNKGEW